MVEILVSLRTGLKEVKYLSGDRESESWLSPVMSMISCLCLKFALTITFNLRNSILQYENSE